MELSSLKEERACTQNVLGVHIHKNEEREVLNKIFQDEVLYEVELNEVKHIPGQV